MSSKNSTKVLFIAGLVLFFGILVILGILLLTPVQSFLGFKASPFDQSVPITPLPIAGEPAIPPITQVGTLVRIEGSVIDENGAGFANVSIEAGSGESKIPAGDYYYRFVWAFFVNTSSRFVSVFCLITGFYYLFLTNRSNQFAG